MKRHPAWLAAGLVIFALLACNLTKNSNSSSSDNRSVNTSNADVSVDRINMAKDDGGKPGDPTSSFAPDERTVYTVVILNKPKEGTRVKWVWLAVDAQPFQKNQQLQSAEYTTGPDDTNVHGHLTWSKDWPQGTYRCEVYLNGVLGKSVNYTVE